MLQERIWYKGSEIVEEFNTIIGTNTAEITEKKSKFIANAFYIENVAEAEQILKEIRKKYHDARHNCYTYRVIEDDNVIERSSDDGEPSGTAGAPMLSIIKNNNLCNILIIVTRYFGGILLGTGGLVRAYTEVTQKVLEVSKKIKKCCRIEVQVKLDYQNLEKLKYYCKNNNILITNIEYLDAAICNIAIEKSIKDKLLHNLEEKNINILEFNVLSNKII